MSKLLLVFLGLIVLATANSIVQTDGDKVKIDFYFESLCPYCQQFISKSLKAAAATKVTIHNIFYLGFLENM